MLRIKEDVLIKLWRHHGSMREINPAHSLGNFPLFAGNYQELNKKKSLWHSG